MIMQLLVIDFVVASYQHHPHRICESVTDDFPIPGRSLGATRHYVGGDSQLLCPDVGIEELLCHSLLVQED